MAKRYRILVDRPEIAGWFPAIPKGSIVTKVTGWDYGLAADDTRITGVQHVSVTANEQGLPPSFTIPLHDLEEIKEGAN